MALRYVSTRSTVLHPDSETDSQDLVLIFGDEVDTTGGVDPGSGRHEVVYRHRTGWVRSDRLTTRHPLELYFIDVGEGDSTFVVTPAGKKILIDGGRGNEAFQFLVWKYRLDMATSPGVEIDLVVISHTDDRHVAGLTSIVEHDRIHVREIVHSGIAKHTSGFDTVLGDIVGSGSSRVLITRHDSIADLVGRNLNDTMTAWRNVLQGEPGLRYRAVDTGTAMIDVGDPEVRLHVLGPRLMNQPDRHQPVFPWLGSAARTVSGNSVVLRLDYGDVRILLPGDINEAGARYLMGGAGFAAEVNAHVLKAPHHGSGDYDEEFLGAIQPQISIVSSGESPDHGHPRADFLGAIGKLSRSRSPLVFSTELVTPFVVDSDAAAPDADDVVDPTDPAMLGQTRRRFKKRLNGIINVRTDGTMLYCARRVAAGYQFVTYEQAPANRDR
ncbi:MAG: hypothetical protein R3344_02865 [Acidobacteriota bacterium]|nr:hypothetical protein [Acidobacteriota bacterium]